MPLPLPLPLPLSLMLEPVLRGLIRLDDDTVAQLDKLDGAVIRVVLTVPNIEIILSVVDREVSLLRVFDAEADLTITGSLQALQSLKQSSAALYRGDVKIEGNLGYAQALREIVSGFDPDWEEPLSAVLGDSVVHQLGAMSRDFTAWFDRTAQGFRDNTSEWFQEEVELLAPNSEVERFCSDVDTLRADVDRLEARINLLSGTTDRPNIDATGDVSAEQPVGEPGRDSAGGLDDKVGEKSTDDNSSAASSDALKSGASIPEQDRATDKSEDESDGLKSGASQSDKDRVPGKPEDGSDAS